VEEEDLVELLPLMLPPPEVEHAELRPVTSNWGGCEPHPDRPVGELAAGDDATREGRGGATTRPELIRWGVEVQRTGGRGGRGHGVVRLRTGGGARSRAWTGGWGRRGDSGVGAGLQVSDTETEAPGRVGSGRMWDRAWACGSRYQAAGYTEFKHLGLFHRLQK
jgi:hypothetical protein